MGKIKHIEGYIHEDELASYYVDKRSLTYDDVKHIEMPASNGIFMFSRATIEQAIQNRDDIIDEERKERDKLGKKLNSVFGKVEVQLKTGELVRSDEMKLRDCKSLVDSIERESFITIGGSRVNTEYVVSSRTVGVYY